MVRGFPFSPASARGSTRLRLVVGPSSAVKGLRLDAHLQVRRPLPLLLVSADSSVQGDQSGDRLPRRGTISSAFLRFLARNPNRSSDERGLRPQASSLWKTARQEAWVPWLPHSSCKAWICTGVPHLVLVQPWEVETFKESIVNVLRLFGTAPASLVAVTGSTHLTPGQFSIEGGESEGRDRHPALSGLDTALGSDAYLILRFGLGRPREHALLERFKQELFSEKEAHLLERKTFPEASEMIQRVLVGDEFASRDKLRFRCDYPLQEGRPKGVDSKAGRSKKNFLNRLQRHLNR